MRAHPLRNLTEFGLLAVPCRAAREVGRAWMEARRRRLRNKNSDGCHSLQYFVVAGKNFGAKMPFTSTTTPFPTSLSGFSSSWVPIAR